MSKISEAFGIGVIVGMLLLTIILQVVPSDCRLYNEVRDQHCKVVGILKEK